MRNSVWLTVVLSLLLAGCVTKQSTNTPISVEISEELPHELALKYINSTMKDSSFHLGVFKMANHACSRVTEKIVTVDALHNGEIVEQWSKPLGALTAHAVKMEYTMMGTGQIGVAPVESGHSYGIYIAGDNIQPSECFVYFHHFLNGKEVLDDKPPVRYGTRTEKKNVQNEMSKVMTALKSLGVNIGNSNVQ